MLVKTADQDHVCRACTVTIKAGEVYWGNSSSAFCKSCGDLKVKGQLKYHKKSDRYVDVTKSEHQLCAYCENPMDHLTWVPHSNRPVCTEHVGRSIEQGDDGVATPSLEPSKGPKPLDDDPIELLDNKDDEESLHNL